MPPVKRGCGFRIAGGVYLVTGLSPFGHPVDHFIVDPPRPVDPAQLGLAAVGVMPFRLPNSEKTHVLNWVGESHYPNPADFIEEVRRHGASTRVPKSFDFSVLSEGAYVYHVHAHAYIDQYMQYLLDPPKEFAVSRKMCPSGKHTEMDTEMCARFWWEDIVGGVYVNAVEKDRTVRRYSGDTGYYGFTAPREVGEVTYQPAVFCRFPIHRLEVVKDPARNSHEEALERAWYADVEVRVVSF